MCDDVSVFRRSATCHPWTARVVSSKPSTALYDFEPGPEDEYQVALSVDDRIEVEEESGGWYKGIVLVEPRRTGLFPASYVQVRVLVVQSRMLISHTIIISPRIHITHIRQCLPVYHFSVHVFPRFLLLCCSNIV